MSLSLGALLVRVDTKFGLKQTKQVLTPVIIAFVGSEVFAVPVKTSSN
jgi:hypothetical protein